MDCRPQTSGPLGRGRARSRQACVVRPRRAACLILSQRTYRITLNDVPFRMGVTTPNGPTSRTLRCNTTTRHADRSSGSHLLNGPVGSRSPSSPPSSPPMELPDYSALWNYSTQDLAGFGSAVADYFQVRWHQAMERCCPTAPPRPHARRFLPAATPHPPGNSLFPTTPTTLSPALPREQTASPARPRAAYGPLPKRGPPPGPPTSPPPAPQINRPPLNKPGRAPSPPRGRRAPPPLPPLVRCFPLSYPPLSLSPEVCVLTDLRDRSCCFPAVAGVSCVLPGP